MCVIGAQGRNFGISIIHGTGREAKDGRRRVGRQGRSGETGTGIIEKGRCEQSLKAQRE